MDYTIKWELVRNSVCTRLKDDSLLHTFDVKKKIKRQTKIFNQKLKKVRTVRSYKHFLSLKDQALIECPDSETETDDEPGFDLEDYKKFYKERGESKSGRLRKFLKSCVRTKGRPSYKNKVQKKKDSKKQLTAAFKKPAKVPGLKNSKQSSTKSKPDAKDQKTLLQCWIKSKIKPSASNLERKNSVPEDAETASRCTRKKSQILKNNNKDVGNNDENSDCAEKSISNSSIQSISNEFPDISKSSICSKESAFINDSMAGHRLEETSIIEAQSSSENHRSEKLLLKSDHEFQTLNNPLNDDCFVNIDGTDAFGTASNSGEISNENNLYREDDLTVIKAENDREDVFLVPFQTDKYALTSDHDSGNNSLSDTNSFYGKNEMRSSEGMVRSNCNEKTATKRNLDRGKKKLISLDEIELDEVARRSNETVETGSLNNDSDTPCIKLATENSLENESRIGNDDNAARGESPEFMDGQEMSERPEVESFAEDEANEGGSIPKIENVEHYEGGYEPCNKRTIQSLNNLTYGVIDSLAENVEDMPTSVQDEEVLRLTKLSIDYYFSSDESNDPHRLLVDEISNVRAEVNENSTSGIRNIDGTSDWGEKSTLEINEQLECKISSTELSFNETRPRSLSPSSIKSFSSLCSRSYDEEFEHCVEAKILAETEEQLKCDETRNDENLSENSHDILQDEKQSFLIESDEERNESITENVRVLANSEFVERSSSPEIRSHDSNESSDIADSVQLPKSTPKKRPISNIDEDYRVFANVLSKKSRPLKQKSHKKLAMSSRICETPETESEELQQAENENDSPNMSNKEPSRPKPKRKHRPRTLEEFVTTKALRPDMTKPHFQTKNITEDDEIWIMDVPKTINPQDLKDQILLLGEKGTMTLGDDCYKVSSKRSKACNISCIFAKSKRRKEYEIVNVEAQGRIKFTQKHSTIPETELISSKITTVPFPKNVWRRHPLLGTVHKTET